MNFLSNQHVIIKTDVYILSAMNTSINGYSIYGRLFCVKCYLDSGDIVEFDCLLF